VKLASQAVLPLVSFSVACWGEWEAFATSESCRCIERSYGLNTPGQRGCPRHCQSGQWKTNFFSLRLKSRRREGGRSVKVFARNLHSCQPDFSFCTTFAHVAGLHRFCTRISAARCQLDTVRQWRNVFAMVFEEFAPFPRRMTGLLDDDDLARV
jgi:hypothetical protein